MLLSCDSGPTMSVVSEESATLAILILMAISDVDAARDLSRHVCTDTDPDTDVSPHVSPQTKVFT